MRNVTKLVLAAIFKQNNSFEKFYFKNVNVFIIFNFETNFISKIPLWLFRQTKIRVLAAILKRNTFWPFSVEIWLFWVYTASFVPNFIRERTKKWMDPSGPPPPCAQMEVKSSLEVLKSFKPYVFGGQSLLNIENVYAIKYTVNVIKTSQCRNIIFHFCRIFISL